MRVTQLVQSLLLHSHVQLAQLSLLVRELDSGTHLESLVELRAAQADPGLHRVDVAVFATENGQG